MTYKTVADSVLDWRMLRMMDLCLQLPVSEQMTAQYDSAASSSHSCFITKFSDTVICT